MTESSVQLQLEAINAKVDRLIDGLFGSAFQEGRIPQLERKVEGHAEELGEHNERLTDLEDARKEEITRSGLVLTFKQKIIAVLIGLPAFGHYAYLLLKDLKIIQ